MVNIGNDWDEVLAEEFRSGYYATIREFLKQEYRAHTVYPDMNNIFRAFKCTQYKDVKIVLLGQDPYHGAGQAEGLCFSVPAGIEYPPSLVNIFKELKSDTGIVASSGSLLPWAERGMLLLNTSLTVRAGQANSHSGCGWTTLTDRVIQKINEKEQPVVFLLWGNNARSKKKFIDAHRHLVLEAPHPSPLSAYNGFFGCKHFSAADAFIRKNYNEGFDFRL